jgi:hypothetical protein
LKCSGLLSPLAIGFVSPGIPTRAAKAPAGPDWVHEIKHDGYRLQVRREGDAVRLFTRRGYDWSGRYPAIAVTATLLRARSFTLDGEAVVCGPDGVAIFDVLHRHGTVSDAMLYAFDLLEVDGKDLRQLPLGDRKKRLARLVGKRRIGIVLSDGVNAAMAESPRRFPSPWRADPMPGGYVVRDANGQALAYFYCRDNATEARSGCSEMPSLLPPKFPRQGSVRKIWIRTSCLTLLVAANSAASAAVRCE